jgi:hypothetical protein
MEGQRRSTQKKMRNAYKILVGKPEGKRSHARPRHGWENTDQVDLKAVRPKDLNWINLTQDTGQ